MKRISSRILCCLLAVLAALSLTGCNKRDISGKWDIYCIEYGPSVIKYIEDLRKNDADYVNYLTFGEDNTVTYNDNGKVYNGTYTYKSGKGVISLDNLDKVSIYYERGVLTVESSGGVWLIFHYKRAK